MNNSYKSNTTPIPNILVDYWMAKLSDHAFCLLIALYRNETNPDRDEGDIIQITDLIEKRGLVLPDCLRELEKHKLIIRKELEDDQFQIILNIFSESEGANHE